MKSKRNNQYDLGLLLTTLETATICDGCGNPATQVYENSRSGKQICPDCVRAVLAGSRGKSEAAPVAQVVPVAAATSEAEQPVSGKPARK